MSRRGSILQDYGNIDATQSTQAQRDAASYYQRDKEQANQMQMHKDSLAEQKAKDSEADKYRKLKMVGDATDPANFQSSTQKINSLATQQLAGVAKEALDKIDLPPEQLYSFLQQKITPISQGFGSYKNDLNDQEAMAKEAIKVNPNLDLQKVLTGLQDAADKYHLIQNPKDGSTSFNQANIGTSSNALQEILKPENAWKYSKGVQPLVDLVGKAGKDAELFSQGTDGSQINYKAKIPDWAQLTDKQGNPINVDPKTGLIPKGVQPVLSLKGTKQDYQDSDENGKPLVNRDGTPVIKQMTVISKDEMKKVLSNDELEYAFEGDWQNHKRLANIDVPTSNEDDLKRVYLSQWLSDRLNQPYISSRTHLPPQPRVTVNNRYGSGSDINPIEVYKGIDEKVTNHSDLSKINNPIISRVTGKPLAATPANILDQNELAEVNNALIKGGYKDKPPTDIYLAKDKDGIWVMDANTDNALVKMNKIGTDTHANTPYGIKARQGVPSKSTATTQAQGSKFNIIDPNTGKVVLSGVDKAAADKAKSKGYKIQ